jgi:hypothetical protein
MKVKTFPTFENGNTLYVTSTNRLSYSDTGPTGNAPPDPTILPDLATVVTQLDQMSTEVPDRGSRRRAMGGLQRRRLRLADPGELDKGA